MPPIENHCRCLCLFVLTTPSCWTWNELFKVDAADLSMHCAPRPAYSLIWKRAQRCGETSSEQKLAATTCSLHVVSGFVCAHRGTIVRRILGENWNLLQMQVCADIFTVFKKLQSSMWPMLSFCRPNLPHDEGLVMISTVPSCCHWLAAMYRPLKWLSRCCSTFYCEFLNMVLCFVFWNSHLSDLTFLAPSAFECPSAWI